MPASSCPTDRLPCLARPRASARPRRALTCRPAWVSAACVLACGVAVADDAPPVEAHAQTTYIWQHKPAFRADYSGPNSLSTQAEKSYTFSGTVFLGLRPWPGAEAFLDAEVVQGVPFSRLTGLGSPPNGEAQKAAGSSPKGYVPRAFIRQTWARGEALDTVDSDVHQMAGMRPRDRLVLSVGKLAVTDIFDQNAYSHDARTQFLTWASLAHGAFDYAADAQGYTWGAALEWIQGDWALRGGRFIGPETSNGQALNLAIGRDHGDQLELEHRHTWQGLDGAVRLLVFRNTEFMGRFDDALALAAAQGGTPDVASVRRRQDKTGFGLHLEQALSAHIGVFLRHSQHDGHTESYSFEEVDRSTQAGVQVKGGAWSRPGDMLGMLALRNGLSASHRAYLAAGGLGFFVGDGRLNYRPEQVLEAYYNLAVSSHAWVAVDAQHVNDPAYNADRGPVNVYSVRLHAQW